MDRVPRLPPTRIARGFLRARGRARRALDAPLPGEAILWDLSMGVARTHMLGAVAELGVADELVARPATAEELAGRLGVDADVLHRLLRALAMDGVFRLDRRGRFHLTRVSQRLRAGTPSSMRAWVRYMALDSTTRAWAGVAHTLRTGDPTFAHVHGRTIWEWFAAHPEEEALFARSMRAVTEIDLPMLVAGYPWPTAGTVCDVAGGDGTLLAGILRARPGLRGVLVDAPGVLREAEGNLARRGVRERVELVPGDMFAGIDARADVYLLKNILHDWDDATCARIIATIRAAMPPGSRLLAITALQERNDTTPVAPLVDVHMLTQCEGGRERSEGEVRALLTAAGLRPGATHRTPVQALVEGWAP